jgi:hypothetical protein
MRDWEAVVEKHLGGLALEPAERADVIAELAAHLAETCEGLRKQGMTEEEAVQRTLSQSRIGRSCGEGFKSPGGRRTL